MFVDFEKAFDRVNWVNILEELKRIGVDRRDTRPIGSLYNVHGADGNSKHR